MFTAPLPVCNNDAGGTFPLYTETYATNIGVLRRRCIFWFISMLSQTASPPRILVHGHRGARARRPENTIPAFQYAIQEGVDALELDMAVTKDNAIVISHDPILQPPVCSGPKESAVIHELTLAEVRQWDCGKVQNPRFPTQMAMPGTRCPRWTRYSGWPPSASSTSTSRPRASRTSRCTAVAGGVRQTGAEGDPQVQAGPADHSAILRFPDAGGHAETGAKIRLSALTETDTREFAAITAEAGNAEIISPEFHLVTGAKVAAAHAAGLQVVPWTADTTEDWEMLIQAKVDATFRTIRPR